MVRGTSTIPPPTHHTPTTIGAAPMSKPLRLAMPKTTEFIDALRYAFGELQIDRSIRAGIDGQPTFWAAEAGQEIGTRATPPCASFTAAQCLAARLPKPAA